MYICVCIYEYICIYMRETIYIFSFLILLRMCYYVSELLLKAALSASKTIESGFVIFIKQGGH